MVESLLPSARVATADGLASLTAPVTVANSLAETVIASYTASAGFFAVGTTILIVASGVAGTTTAAPTMTWRLRRGGTAGTQLASIAITPAVSMTNKGWRTEFILTCRSTGAGGTVFTDGICFNELSTVAPNFAKLGASTATAVWDTTAQSTLDLTFTFSAAAAANTLTLHNGLYLLSKV